MSAAHIANHVARRAVDKAQNYFADADDEYIGRLQEEAKLYDATGPEGEVSPLVVVPALVIILAVFICSTYFNYAVGSVAASLAMIETAPADLSTTEYRDEADAPLLEKDNKESEANAVESEVLVRSQKPVTSSIRATLRHLRASGGTFRGFRLSILYNLMHNLPIQLFVPTAWGFLVRAAMSVVMSVLLSRMHMLWTHAMIATPSTKSFFARLMESSPRNRALFAPSLVFALAQQAVILVPAGLVYMLAMGEMDCEETFSAACDGDPEALAIAFMAVILVPVSALLMAIGVLLPAAIALARVEAALLPEDQDTIVPFNRHAILGAESVATEGADKLGTGSRRRCHGAVFVRAWKSVSCGARAHMVKLYAKMYLIQFVLLVIGVHLAIVSVIILGGDNLGVFFRSASAQLQLMMIEVEKGRN